MSGGERVSNYELTKGRMARRFLDYDQEEMIRRFRLDSDRDWIRVRLLGRTYEISRAEGTVYAAADGGRTEAGFNEAMTLYDVLCGAKRDAALSGELVKVEGLVSAASTPSGELFGGRARTFDGREGALARACEALGGEAFGKGDVAYRLPLFDFLPVVFQFWRSDDEFPASIQLLWDRNTTDFMHFETVWYAAGHVLDRLTELVSEE